MKKILCPSMMCADYACLEREVRLLEEAGSDILHIDVMDGKFVPNFGMGPQDIQCIARLSKIPVDVHLMIDAPDDYIELFASLGADIIYIHPETTKHPARVLQKIRSLGKKAGIAVTPHITAAGVEPLLNLSDYVLVMTVNPGFAGQTFLDFCEPKLLEFAAMKERYGYQLCMDGACSPDRISRLSKAGVDGFVLGTSALFGKGEDYKTILRKLRES